MVAIYTSTDSGETWIPRIDDVARTWRAVSSSSDGVKLAAAVFDGYIYTSVDSGITWTQSNLPIASWQSIASSSDGMKLAISSQLGGYVYTTTDGGINWVKREFPYIGGNLYTMTSSADGTKLVVVTSTNGYMYFSNDSGVTWIEKRGFGLKNWRGVVSSSDGSKIFAAANGNYIYTGINSYNPNVLTLNNLGICPLDTSGTATAICNYIVQPGDDNIFDLSVTSIAGDFYDLGGNLTTNLDIPINLADNKDIVINTNGATITNITSTKADGTYTTGDEIDINVTFSKPIYTDWSQKTSLGKKGWYKMAFSNESKLIAQVGWNYSGYIYLSNDSGNTWTEKNPGYFSWSGISSSLDGMKLAMTSGTNSRDGFIYTSNDAGNTWVKQENAGYRKWYAIASSLDGEKLVAGVYGGYIYTSTDSGFTWIQSTSNIGNWISIDSSFDGKKIVVGEYPGYIYTSTDSGNTWTQRIGSVNHRWMSVASSADGEKLVAVRGASSADYIYTSTDSGVTWIPRLNDSVRNWWGVASSSDGTKLAAVVRGGYIYTSIDSGVNWVPQTGLGSRSWMGVALSADGNKIIAGVENGYLYTGNFGDARTTVLTLETGARDETCVLTATGSNTASCTYTVQAGDNTSDLSVKSITGNYYDSGGVATIDFTIPTNLDVNSNIVIESNYFAEVSDVNITGTPNENQLLTGHYKYFDTEGDLEGTSIYKWLRDGVAIDGATSITYRTTDSDIGSMIKFEVTPVALTGTSIGLPVQSQGLLINKKNTSSGSSISSRYNNLLNMGNTQSALELQKQFPSQITPNPVIQSTPNTSTPTTYLYTTRTLKLLSPRMKGTDVKELQTYLKDKGYSVGVIDGVFGPKTEQAVKLFQTANNLIPDGKVGKMTRGVMR